MDLKKKLLVICGPSGSGKSYLENKLCELYPDKYTSLLQFTTRPRREEDKLDSYLFLGSVTDADLMKRGGLKIIGETEIMNDVYGTFLNETVGPDVIQTVVLNRMGIDNLKNSPHLKDYKVKTLKVLASPEVEVPHRYGRTEDYIQKEIDSLMNVEDILITRTLDPFNYEDLDSAIQKLFED